MQPPGNKPRLVVVSPFLDKRHGTERCVAEQVERLSDAYEIHLYSERVEDTDLGKIEWHRVPVPPGPYVFRYVWWLLANHTSRWIDRRLRGLDPDVVYSPGVNCVDADVIAVHIVFAELPGSRAGLRGGVAASCRAHGAASVGWFAYGVCSRLTSRARS